MCTGSSVSCQSSAKDHIQNKHTTVVVVVELLNSGGDIVSSVHVLVVVLAKHTQCDHRTWHLALRSHFVNHFIAHF